METIKIAGREIGQGRPPYIVAELGSNHNGDMNLLRDLVDAAQECGADAVKLQSWTKSSLVSKAELARNAEWAGTRNLSSLEEELERYQVTPDQHMEIAEHCGRRGVVFFSSCFSEGEADMLQSLAVPAYKIASMDINYPALLDYVAGKGKPVILSTGLASLGEIEIALGRLREAQAPVALLHCVSLYPSPPETVNLRNIETLRQAFQVPVGYSDHCLGIGVALAAVALGAVMVEKHFTLDKQMPGWDHSVSADPPEMRELVERSREIFCALGSPVRSLTSSQMEKRKVFRRRAVLTRAVHRGEKLTESDLTFKRPGVGIGPDEVRYVLDRGVNRDLEAEAELEWRDLS